MYDVDSAECLKNIILHLNDILSLDAIQGEYARKQDPQERDDDILTYDENQPRVPAGSPEGGQWTSGGGSGGSGGSGSSSGSNPRERISQYSDSLSSNFKINALSGDGYSYLKPETVGSINVGAVDAMHQIESDYNNRIFQEEVFKSIADGSTPLLASNGNIAARAGDFAIRNFNTAKNTAKNKAKDSALIALSAATKIYAKGRLEGNPKAIKENPDFVKASTAFALGMGGTFNFDESSQWTKDLKNHKHFVSGKNRIISGIENKIVKEGDVIDVSLSYSKKGKLENLTQLASDGMNVITFGRMGTPNSYTTGSIVGKVTVKNINYEGRSAELVFNLSDKFRMGSATRLVNSSWSLIKDNPSTSTGKTILKDVNLNWTWSEKVSF